MHHATRRSFLRFLVFITLALGGPSGAFAAQWHQDAYTANNVWNWAAHGSVTSVCVLLVGGGGGGATGAGMFVGMGGEAGPSSGGRNFPCRET